jgi:hypothetical protein
MLLPTWMAALVAATAPLWLGREFESVAPPFFGVAILALALSPFGLETSYGTFGLLLVQPEDRRRFWRIKTGLLAVALVSAWALFILCLWSSQNLVRNVDWMDRDAFAEFLKWSALLMLVAFSGGLWSTLLLRDMVSAFFCTLIVPVGICGAIAAAASHWMDLNNNHDTTLLHSIFYWALAAYAVAGVLWARRLFLGAQDVPWTGGQISLTAVRGVSFRWLAFAFTGRQNRWTALVKKELQLQEITMFLIPILVLFHLAALTICHFAPERIPKEVCNVVPFIWLAAVPFVIGCVTVAEERRLNTLESFLCLPVSKRASFAVKFVVALVLGIVLGGIVPWVLLRMGGVIRPRDFELKNAVEIAAGIVGIAFYASTMSRGLLQALPTTACIPTVAGMVIALVSKFTDQTGMLFTHSSLFPALAWPAAIITFLWLAFNNYKRLQIGWRVWLGDFTRAGAVAGCVTLATFAIFDRSWELFQTLEPRHGPARISGAGQASIGVSQEGLCVLLPDGRLWIGKKLWAGEKKHRTLKSISGGFAHGSNWVKMAASFKEAVAMKSDGTLWKIPNGSDIRQIGSDSDWKEIAAGVGTFMAVKQDGTLWGWGIDANGMLSGHLNHHGDDIPVADPIRVGDDSDWVNVFIPDDQYALGVKRDGTTWQWGYFQQFGPDGQWGRGAVHPVRQMVHWPMEGTNWSSIVSFWGLTLGIRTDGSLWAAGNVPSKIFGEKDRSGMNLQAVRVGTKLDWVALSGKWQFAALEANGTLWTMEYQYGSWDQVKRPSQYADWLAATEYYSLTWALAKDGTLTCWNEFTIDWPDDDAPFMKRFFLGPTRRPVLSVNILGEPQ